MDITIVETGASTSIQDHGRPAAAGYGVPPAGSIDRETADAVNAAVGNAPSAPLLETAGGLIVEVKRPVVVASSLDRRVVRVDAGARIEVGADPSRRWSYLAFGGGVDVVQVQGSASQDSRFGIGPLPLVAGTSLRLGSVPSDQTQGASAVTSVTADDPNASFTVWPGPHSNVLAAGIESMTSSAWTIQSIDRQSCVAFGLAPWAEARPRPRLFHVPVGSLVLDDSSLLRVVLPDHPTTTWGTLVGRIDRSAAGQLAQRPVGAPIHFRS